MKTTRRNIQWLKEHLHNLQHELKEVEIKKRALIIVIQELTKVYEMMKDDVKCQNET